MIRDYYQGLRALSRDAHLALFTSALVGFAIWGGMYSVLLNLYLLRLGYGPQFIGWINASGLLAIALFSLPIGLIGARVDARRTLIAGMALSGAGFVALPFAELASGSLRSSLLLATYFLGYLGLALRAVDLNPFLAAATGERGSGHAFSLNQVVSALGSFLGSFVAGLLPGRLAVLLNTSLDGPAPYRYALICAGALLFMGIPAFAATKPPATRSRHRATTERGAAPVALIAVLSLVGVLSVTGEGTARTFFNVYLDTGLSVSTSRIGTLSALAQLLALPAALAMPLLSTRFGRRQTLLFSYAARALCLLPLALLPHWLAAGSGFIAVMMVAGLNRPALIAFHQESVRPRWRAAISGATTTAAGLGFGAAAFGGGYLVTGLGYRALFLTGAALSLAAALLFWATFFAWGRRRPLGGETDSTPR